MKRLALWRSWACRSGTVSRRTAGLSSQKAEVTREGRSHAVGRKRQHVNLLIRNDRLGLRRPSSHEISGCADRILAAKGPYPPHDGNKESAFARVRPARPDPGESGIMRDACGHSIAQSRPSFQRDATKHCRGGRTASAAMRTVRRNVIMRDAADGYTPRQRRTQRSHAQNTPASNLKQRRPLFLHSMPTH